MEGEKPLPGPIRFATFEADATTGELRKAGKLVKLQEQPFQLLILLLERSGGIVTREEAQEKLWGPTNVDFEDGLNTAVRKLRDALGDSAVNPRFIETLPRRGYRFIAPIQPPTPIEPTPALAPVHRSRRLSPWVAGGMAVCVVALLAGVWLNREPASWAAMPPVQVTRDSGLTTDPAISRDGLLLAYASDRGDTGNLEIWLQHVSGGEARRLTDDPADDYEPDISPDGSEVIFRSERDGGGIYSIPTNGGTPRLVVKSAYVPRYSPDGTRIAYAVGHYGSGGFLGMLHVLTRATGATRSLAPGMLSAGSPAWAPDGQYLAFAGSSDYVAPPDLWICPSNGGEATRLAPLPQESSLALFGRVQTLSTAWFEDQLILSSAMHGGNANLWTARIAPERRQLTSELRRITLGSGNEVLPSVSGNGKLVFANQNHAANIWELTLDKTGVAQRMRRLTHDRALNHRPSVSADGKKLTFISDRTGKSDVWIKDLPSGKETQLTRAAQGKLFAATSRDGRQAAYWDGHAIYLASVSDGASRLLCEKCGRPDVWTNDGKLILSPRLDAYQIRVVDPGTRQVVTLVDHQTLNVQAPDLSKDGKWLVFHTAETKLAFRRQLTSKRQIFVAPYTGQFVAGERWIAVTDGTALDREAKWSADGNRIYFLSDRDGFRCIWARNLDPVTKRPERDIYPVMHSHNHGQSLLLVPDTGYVSLSPVDDQRIILAMGELTGNLWVTQMQRR